MKRGNHGNWSLGAHLNDWVSTPHILDGKARIPRWSLALNERRNLLQTCSMKEKSPLHKEKKMPTCGYAPRRHPHTSRIALSYLTLSRVEAPPSSVQQDSQSAITAPSSNCFRSWQEEHSSFAELKPRSRHLVHLS